MSYIGKEPQYTDFLSKFFNGDGTAMTVTLDAVPPNEAALLVFIDGVRQDTSAYTVSGYSLTFTGTVPSGTNNVQVVHLGIAQDTQVPVDDSVSTVKIQDDAVTSAKLDTNIAIDGDLTVDTNTLYVDSANNRVGIGTSSPAKDLDVSGEIRASTGILFGTDTAAANALDDYEEGTWTPALQFGGASTGITYSQQNGYYAKIGRVVVATVALTLTNKGTATGTSKVTLPFTAGNLGEHHTQPYMPNVTCLGRITNYAQPLTGGAPFVDQNDSGGATFMNDTNFANNSIIRSTIVYETA